jgi:hypothetical protein
MTSAAHDWFQVMLPAIRRAQTGDSVPPGYKVRYRHMGGGNFIREIVPLPEAVRAHHQHIRKPGEPQL